MDMGGQDRLRAGGWSGCSCCCFLHSQASDFPGSLLRYSPGYLGADNLRAVSWEQCCSIRLTWVLECRCRCWSALEVLLLPSGLPRWVEPLPDLGKQEQVGGWADSGARRPVQEVDSRQADAGWVGERLLGAGGLDLNNAWEQHLPGWVGAVAGASRPPLPGAFRFWVQVRANTQYTHSACDTVTLVLRAACRYRAAFCAERRRACADTSVRYAVRVRQTRSTAT